VNVKKTIGSLIAVFGMLAGATVMMGASQGKIDWCHFPPGGWTGDPATSHALILSISVNADGTPQGGQHLNHAGDGPLSVLGPNCGAGQQCGTATVIGGSGIVQLELVNGVCVCPSGTGNAGQDPTTTGGSCGGAG
jgi:hypothetical protein